MWAKQRKRFWGDGVDWQSVWTTRPFSTTENKQLRAYGVGRANPKRQKLRKKDQESRGRMGHLTKWTHQPAADVGLE